MRGEKNEAKRKSVGEKRKMRQQADETFFQVYNVEVEFLIKRRTRKGRTCQNSSSSIFIDFQSFSSA